MAVVRYIETYQAATYTINVIYHGNGGSEPANQTASLDRRIEELRSVRLVPTFLGLRAIGALYGL